MRDSVYIYLMDHMLWYALKVSTSPIYIYLYIQLLVQCMSYIKRIGMS